MALKKGSKGTDYILSTELLVMINVVLDFKGQVRTMCWYTEVYNGILWYTIVVAP